MSMAHIIGITLATIVGLIMLRLGMEVRDFTITFVDGLENLPK